MVDLIEGWRHHHAIGLEEPKAAWIEGEFEEVQKPSCLPLLIVDQALVGYEVGRRGEVRPPMLDQSIVVSSGDDESLEHLREGVDENLLGFVEREVHALFFLVVRIAGRGL